MKKNGYTAEQIITMLREAEVLLSQGRAQLSKQQGNPALPSRLTTAGEKNTRA